MRYEKPYKVIVVLENNPTEYAVVRRKAIPESSFPGGGELKVDHSSPLETGLRELCEETGITKDKIDIIRIEKKEGFKKDTHIVYARMKKVDIYPGWISKDNDISHYEWMSLEKLRQVNLTKPDHEIMLALYISVKFHIAA